MWIKLWTKMLNDDKIETLSHFEFRMWIRLLLVYKEHVKDGYSGSYDNVTVSLTLSLDRFLRAMKQRRDVMSKILSKFTSEDFKLIEYEISEDGKRIALTIINFERYQITKSAKRMRKHRNNHRHSDAEVTGSITHPSRHNAPGEEEKKRKSTSYSASEDENDPILLSHRCKDDKMFHLRESWVEKKEKVFSEMDVRTEVQKAIQWLEDNPSRNKTSGGMKNYIGSWLNRSQNRGTYAQQGENRQECDSGETLDIDRDFETILTNIMEGK